MRSVFNVNTKVVLQPGPVDLSIPLIALSLQLEGQPKYIFWQQAFLRDSVFEQAEAVFVLAFLLSLGTCQDQIWFLALRSNQMIFLKLLLSGFCLQV